MRKPFRNTAEGFSLFQQIPYFKLIKLKVIALPCYAMSLKAMEKTHKHDRKQVSPVL